MTAAAGRSVADAEAAAYRGLRRRLTASVAIVLAVVLGVASVLIVGHQRRELFAVVDESLTTRADDLEARLADGIPSVFLDRAVEDHLVQLVAGDGTVLASTPNLDGFPPVAGAPAGVQRIVNRGDLPIEDDAFRLLSRRLGGGMVVHIAENIDDVNDSVRILTFSLLIGVPLVIAVLVLLSRWLIERTLRPVAATNARHRRFIGDASHELRSPLARLRSRLEVDLAHAGGVDFRATAADALHETISMQHLVDDLLLLARSDAGAPASAPTDVDLDDVVLGEARSAAARSPVAIDVSGVSAATVRGDPAQLGQLVRNLLDNAVTHAGGQVTLGLHERDGAVTLDVDDDGPGIPAGRRREVFERFVRLDDSRRSGTGGAGLGLSIALEIALRHHGSLTITDSPRGGARFTFTAPAAHGGRG